MPMTPGERGFYTAVVCREGHVLTSMKELMPEEATPYCPACASATVEACDSCGQAIPGHTKGSAYAGSYEPPAYCRYCAAPMPWTASRLTALHELTNIDMGLTEEERTTLNQSWDELTRDTPRTEIAVVQVKRLLPKIAKESIGAVRTIITDVATQAALKKMGF